MAFIRSCVGEPLKRNVGRLLSRSIFVKLILEMNVHGRTNRIFISLTVLVVLLCLIIPSMRFFRAIGGLANTDEAFRWLKACDDLRSVWMIWIKVDPSAGWSKVGSEI